MSGVNATERLARIIENDANGDIKRTLRVAQSDIMSLLCEYMDVKKLDMTVNKCEEGYEVAISAVAARIRSVGNTTDSD